MRNIALKKATVELASQWRSAARIFAIYWLHRLEICDDAFEDRIKPSPQGFFKQIERSKNGQAETEKLFLNGKLVLESKTTEIKRQAGSFGNQRVYQQENKIRTFTALDGVEYREQVFHDHGNVLDLDVIHTALDVNYPNGRHERYERKQEYERKALDKPPLRTVYKISINDRTYAERVIRRGEICDESEMFNEMGDRFLLAMDALPKPQEDTCEIIEISRSTKYGVPTAKINRLAKPLAA
jgi:hypothetical protein